jgi:hypothetical protein
LRLPFTDGFVIDTFGVIMPKRLQLSTGVWLARQWLLPGMLLLACLLVRAEDSERPCTGIQGVNIFLVDNSRSVPVIDSRMERSQVLRELLNLLPGFENRLILFGGRSEIVLDDPDRFISDGWHTDFYYGFKAAVEVRHQYPAGCDVKIILITDGVLDAFPEDYPEERFQLRPQAQSFAREQTYQLLARERIPTYIILLGDAYDPYLIEQFSIKANGLAQANPLVEKASEFLKNDGFLLKRFVFRVKPEVGLPVVKEIVRKIVTEDAPRVEYALVLLLVAALLVFTILAIRSFPAPGDREIIDLTDSAPVLIGLDPPPHMLLSTPRRRASRRGLQPVVATSAAVASVSYQRRIFDFTSRGLKSVQRLSTIYRQLLDMDVRDLGRHLERMERGGTDEEIIAATDLKYYCSNMDVDHIKSILRAREMERMDIDAKEFLMAKVYVSLAPDLLQEMTEQRITLSIPGRNIIRAQLQEGQEYDLGRYRVRVVALRKDSLSTARLILEYVRMPSTLGLKRFIPAAVQRLIRFRRPISAFFNTTGQ